jgi:hypothetical protein
MSWFCKRIFLHVCVCVCVCVCYSQIPPKHYLTDTLYLIYNMLLDHDIILASLRIFKTHLPGTDR